MEVGRRTAIQKTGPEVHTAPKRDILRGVLAGSRILIAALLLIFGLIWLVQR